MNARPIALVALLLLLPRWGHVDAAGARDAQLHSREAYAMGTRVELAVAAGTRARGLERLERMFATIERTEAELSTWRAESEISRLNAGAGLAPQRLTPSLCQLFERLDGQVRETGGAFDPAIGSLVTAWDLHGSGRVPSGKQLAAARARSGWRLLSLDVERCTLQMPAGTSIDVGAFGKGQALDRVREAMDPAESWMVDLGGQVAVSGPPSAAGGWAVAIAHPEDRTAPAVPLRMARGSLATSAGSERDPLVDRTRVGHILDPRTGAPGRFLGSVSVWAASALAADALSTALHVMGPDDGLRWADRRGVAALFLEVAPGGALRRRPSRAFSRMFDAGPTATGLPSNGASGVARAQNTRTAFLRIIDQPRVPLAPEATPFAADRDALRQRVSFAVQAGERVPGLLWKATPAAGRRPAVILMHGTGGSKEDARIVGLAHDLAARGFVAVAIDGRHHGERAKPGARAGEDVDAMLRAWQTGRTHPFLYDTVWDILRLVDYLETREDVDAARIGLTGISKGGIETYLAAAVEPRITAAVPVIGVQSFRLALEHDSWQSRVGTFQAAIDAAAAGAGTPVDAAFVRRFYDRVVPGIYGEFDAPAMLPLIAPRALLVINGDSDARTPIDGVRESAAAAERAYRDAGVPERFSLYLQPKTGHEFTDAAQTAAVEWFVRWLKP